MLGILLLSIAGFVIMAFQHPENVQRYLQKYLSGVSSEQAFGVLFIIGACVVLILVSFALWKIVKLLGRLGRKLTKKHSAPKPDTVAQPMGAYRPPSGVYQPPSVPQVPRTHTRISFWSGVKFGLGFGLGLVIAAFIAWVTYLLALTLLTGLLNSQVEPIEIENPVERVGELEGRFRNYMPDVNQFD